MTISVPIISPLIAYQCFVLIVNDKGKREKGQGRGVQWCAGGRAFDI